VKRHKQFVVNFLFLKLSWTHHIWKVFTHSDRCDIRVYGYSVLGTIIFTMRSAAFGQHCRCNFWILVSAVPLFWKRYCQRPDWICHTLMTDEDQSLPPSPSKKTCIFLGLPRAMHLLACTAKGYGIMMYNHTRVVKSSVARYCIRKVQV
jgi:hypothetical protein